MVAGPLKLVEATDAPYGLIRSARVAVTGSLTEPADLRAGYVPQTESPEETAQLRWQNGYYIDPEGCGGGTVIDPCGATGGEDPTEPADIGPINPFVLTAAVDCSTFGSLSDEMYARAVRRLAGTRSYLLEREFWVGTAAQANSWSNQYLTKTGAGGIQRTVENGTAVGTTTALAELEQAIADGTSWGVGMIHAQPRTVTYWSENGLVTATARPGLYTTLLGTIVVAGRGYPGTGPGGASAFQGADSGIATTSGQYAWAYATSQVFVRLGPVMTATEEDYEAVDPAANTRLVRARQDAIASWDGCVHAGVFIDHNATRTALGS